MVFGWVGAQVALQCWQVLGWCMAPNAPAGGRFEGLHGVIEVVAQGIGARQAGWRAKEWLAGRAAAAAAALGREN